LLALLATLPGPQEVTVDCDAGDSLARALAKAVRRPGTTIHVRGTCSGSFTVAAEGVHLAGDPTAPAVIQGPDDAIANRVAVLDVVAERFSMRDLTVRGGWIGVWAHGGTRSQANVIGSTFEDNYGGVLVDAGSYASILNSTFQSNEVGVAVQFGSRGSIVECDIRDSGLYGVDVFDNSAAGVFRSSVSGSGSAGIAASIGSRLGIGEGTLSENGGAHAVALDQSWLRIGPNATLGSGGDGTQLAVFLDDTSILRSFSGVELWGDVFASGGCHLSLGAIVLHGSLWLDEFADANLSRTEVEGTVECSRGADAFCDNGVTAAVVGCASAAPPCSAAPPRSDDSKRPTRDPRETGEDLGASGLRELRSGDRRR
jgi:hypothetical protein